MKVSKVKDIFTDWVKSGFYFGKTFSNYVAGKLEISPDKARVGTTAFDTLAGAAITYSAATSILGTLTGVAVAVTALAAAPVSAIATIAVAPIFLALSTIWGGIGIGLLDSAREKIGIGSRKDVAPKARAFAKETSSVFQDIASRGRKATADFTSAVRKNKAATQAPADKPASKPSDLKP